MKEVIVNVSIIVDNILQAKIEARTINSLIPALKDFATVNVVDNASKHFDYFYTLFDGRKDARFNIVELPERYGVNKFRNYMRCITKEPYILSIDCDVDMTQYPDTIEKMLESCKLPEVGLVSSLTNVTCAAIQKQIPDNMEQDGKSKYPCYTRELIPSMCIMYPRIVAEKIGGWDENYDPRGYGDLDFCRRILSHKYKVLIDTRVWVDHVSGVTTPHSEQRKYIDKHRIYYLGKYGGEWNPDEIK